MRRGWFFLLNLLCTTGLGVWGYCGEFGPARRSPCLWPATASQLAFPGAVAGLAGTGTFRLNPATVAFSN
ncbi:MAG: hypothetical protein ONB23_04045 [candidate division KSB1 bacterium]|nr:hypothetical protein [candidate division KSB1 bacterium]